MVKNMIYIIDNISNYLIYLFIIYYGFRLSPRKSRFFLSMSVLIVFFAGAFNAYFDTNSPFVYIFWSVLSICLFFEERLGHLIVLSAALMYFTGIIDTFSVMLIQVMMIGGGISSTDIAWWMEPAYLLSFVIYPNPDKPEKILQFLHISSAIKKNVGGCVHVTYR